MPPGATYTAKVDGKAGTTSPSAGALVSNLRAQAGAKSIRISGSSDLVHEFALAGGKWVLTAWQYIPSQTTGTTYFILLNTYKDGGPNDWSIQTQYNLATGAITPWSGAVGQGGKIKYNEWVPIQLVIDLDGNTFEEYYDGVMIATDQWDDDAHGTFQAIDLYGNSASSVYYDEITIDNANPPVSQSCFPQPAYDSGWLTTPFGKPNEFYTKQLIHNVGGDTDDYVVDLQMRVSGIAGPNVTNQGLGNTYSYSFLTASGVYVTAPYSAVDLVTSVRVRIWVYDCETDD